MEKPPTPKRASRFSAGLPAVLDGAVAGQPCEAQNLSRSGVLLIGPLTARPGEVVHVTLCSSGGDVRVRVAGTAARVEPDPDADGDSLVGVEFRDLDEDAKLGLETLIARVLEAGGPAVLDSVPANAGPEQIRIALEKIPLTIRIALAARAATSRERGLLLHDPQPQVLESLSRNPHLLPPEVRLLLRQPLLLPSTLESLGRDPRWRNTEELRVLIAAHHAVPLPLAEQVVATLSPAGVELLLRQGSLNPAVRRKATQKRTLR
jgi:hypothetical protein